MSEVHAIRYHELGGPEVLEWQAVELADPADDEVRIRHTAIGVNLKDIGERTGDYPGPDLPAIPGSEAAGVIEACGRAVENFKPGDRVAYAGLPPGAYCEARNMPAERVVLLPDEIDSDIAAATLLKGMTARYLVKKTYPVKKGDTILVHAAAGGTGTLICQWAKHLGARVIGTVSSHEKAQIAAQNGCDHTIIYTEEDFVARVREITDGEGLPVVYDSVGKDTFYKSLDCLDPMGLMVLFGVASGHPAPLELMKFDIWKGYYYTRPSLHLHTRTREQLLESADDLFDVLASGAVKAHISARFSLKEAAAAHTLIESRKTTGSVILQP